MADFCDRRDPPPSDPDGVTEWNWVSVCSVHPPADEATCPACNAGSWMPAPRPIVPAVGRGPWEPSPTSTFDEDDMLDYYDYPLSGVIADRGYRYLFCEIDADDDPRRSWWAYVETGACERELLDGINAMPSFEDIVTVIDHWTRGHTVVVAQCDDGFDIVDVETFGSFREAATRVLSRG